MRKSFFGSFMALAIGVLSTASAFAGSDWEDCFPGGFACNTEVATDSGWSCLESIGYSSEIVAFDSNLNPRLQEVRKFLDRNVNVIYRLGVNRCEGEMITLADNQMILTKANNHWEWKEVKNLAVGDLLVAANREVKRIEVLERVYQTQTVKHIELVDVHTFAVGRCTQIIVHNPWKLPTSKKDWSTIGREAGKVGDATARVANHAKNGAAVGVAVGQGEPDIIAVGATVGALYGSYEEIRRAQKEAQKKE